MLTAARSLTEADDDRSIQLELGGTIIVALSSSPSTGFSWHLVGLSASRIDLAGELPFVRQASIEPVFGAPGTEFFTFRSTDRGTDAGTCRIVLEYRQDFDPDTPAARTFAIAVDAK